MANHNISCGVVHDVPADLRNTLAADVDALAAREGLMPLLIGRALLFNGVIGVATRYLYWRSGLTAMLVHFSATLVLHGRGDAIAVRGERWPVTRRIKRPGAGCDPWAAKMPHASYQPLTASNKTGFGVKMSAGMS